MNINELQILNYLKYRTDFGKQVYISMFTLFALICEEIDEL